MAQNTEKAGERTSGLIDPGGYWQVLIDTGNGGLTRTNTRVDRGTNTY